MARVAAGEVGHLRPQVHLGIGHPQAQGGGLGLGPVDVLLQEQDLPLEIGGLHQVPVDEGEVADPGPGQPGGDHRTGGAQAHHRDPARPQPGVGLAPEEDALLGVAVDHAYSINDKERAGTRSLRELSYLA